MKPDPRVRPDGMCVVCRQPRKLTREARRYAGDQLLTDPFCSRSCCERWHRTGEWAPSPDGQCRLVVAGGRKGGKAAPTGEAKARCEQPAVEGEPFCEKHMRLSARTRHITVAA